MKTKSSQRRKPSITVGKRVSFRIGSSRLRGTVIEDRGRIGKGGRRILRIRLLSDGIETDDSVEMPQEELVAARTSNGRK